MLQVRVYCIPNLFFKVFFCLEYANGESYSWALVILLEYLQTKRKCYCNKVHFQVPASCYMKCMLYKICIHVAQCEIHLKFYTTSKLSYAWYRKGILIWSEAWLKLTFCPCVMGGWWTFILLPTSPHVFPAYDQPAIYLSLYKH